MYFLDVYFINDSELICLKELKKIEKSKDILSKEYIFSEFSDFKFFNPLKVNMFIRYKLRNQNLNLKKNFEKINFVKHTNLYKIKEINNEIDEINIDIESIDNIINEINDLYKLKRNFLKYKNLLEKSDKIKFENEIKKFYKNKFRLQNMTYNLKVIDIKKEIVKIRNIIENYSKLLNVSSNIIINYDDDIKIEKLIFSKIKDILIDRLYSSILKFSEYENNYNFELIFNIFQNNNKLIINIIENGIGLNIQDIYQKAISLNILNKNVKYNEEEILMSIFDKSFVNSEKNVEIKERLMTDVKFNFVLKSLGANIKVNNKKDEYFKIDIEIPLKLVYLDFHIVKINKNYYAIESNKVEDVFDFNVKNIKEINNFNYYHYKNLDIAYVNLPFENNKNFNKKALLIKNSGNGYTIISLEKFISKEKLFFEFDAESNIFMGNSFLENGIKVKIINIDKLINLLKG